MLEVDLVYLWVNGNDPEWLKKKQPFVDDDAPTISETNCAGRYFDNGELRYSLRSVEQYAPWIRRIFIVTDNQVPEWLNTTNPKVQIVDHRDILPEAALPCFNSSVIEYFLYKIPGLSEHFLFSNDDMFFNKAVNPYYFFAEDGLPYIRLKRKILGRIHYPVKRLMGKRLGQYITMVLEGASLVKQKFGVYYSGIPHHNIDAYAKSDYREAAEKVFKDQVKKSQLSHIRTYGDLHRSTFSYYALAVGRGYLKYVRRKESSRIQVYSSSYKRYLERYQPDLFCLNDSQRVTDEDRKKIKPFLEELFPQKSSFEK